MLPPSVTYPLGHFPFVADGVLTLRTVATVEFFSVALGAPLQKPSVFEVRVVRVEFVIGFVGPRHLRHGKPAFF